MEQTDKSKADRLLDFVKDVSSERSLRIEEELGYGYVRLRITEAERRQALQDIRSVEDVVRELFRNARDAGARRVYIAFQKEKDRYRHIAVIDDGCGIPPEIQDRIFDSRVTSKVEGVLSDPFGVHGRGMALFSMRATIDRVDLVYSEPDCGAVLKAVVDTRKVPEKKDQSTYPRLVAENGGEPALAGTRNVPRLLLEFALSGEGPAIYLGSNAEVLATLLHHARNAWQTDNPEGPAPVFVGLADVTDAKLLRDFAESRLGLQVSERNCFRILEGEIPPLADLAALPLKTQLKGAGEGQAAEPETSTVRRGKLQAQPLAKRLSERDLEVLAARIAEAFNEVGRDYFMQALDPSQVKIRRKRDHLTVNLPLASDDDLD